MNLFNIAAALTLNSDEYEKGLDKAEQQAKGFGKSVGAGLKAVGSAFLTIGAAATTAAATGITALTTKAIEGYAEYEQLVGGVETLFDKSADVVLGYANQAYKTAGISANEYMSTVTSFSASLLQSLGGDTEAAAAYADMAITDMSDNANKMGTSMEAIQNAYQGFAKGNFTMLDNLKLGYGGTASEMARLIEDAEKLDSSFVATRDENGKLTMSYADIVDAIHIVQDNMGVTGTTAAEASKTISGSINSMKAAWSNLVTSMADENADLDGAIDGFIESAGNVLDNLLPRISTAISGIGKVVAKLAPQLIQMLKKALIDNLPLLTSAVITLVKELATSLIEVFPVFTEALLMLVNELATSLIENLPIILDTLLTVAEMIATNIGENLPVLIPAVIEAILQLAQVLIEHLPDILTAVLTVIEGLAQGIIAAIPIIIDALPPLILGVVNFLISAIPQIIQTGITLLVALVEAMPTIVQSIVKALPEIISGIIEALTNPDTLALIIQAGFDLLIALIDAIPQIVVELAKAIPQIITGIVDALAKGWEKIKQAGGDLLKGLWEGIKNSADWLWNKIKEWAGSLLDGLKNFLGIHSPSTVFRDIIGKNLVAGLGEGIDRYGDIALDSMYGLADDIIAAAEIEPTLRFKNGLNGLYGDNRQEGVQITQNIYAEKMSPSEVFEEAREQQERWLLLGV